MAKLQTKCIFSHIWIEICENIVFLNKLVYFFIKRSNGVIARVTNLWFLIKNSKKKKKKTQKKKKKTPLGLRVTEQNF